jgi:endonuclease-3
MTKKRALEVLRLLRETFKMPEWTRSERDPFTTLVVTIISQNTNDRNTSRAFEKLSKRFRITPEALSNARTSDLEQCLRVAGLFRNKARVIKQVSKSITEDLGGDINVLLSLPLEQARRKLLDLPGVGPKTADVVLLFTGTHKTIPVDTHVDRVSKRLGLASEKAKNEIVRGSLESLYSPSDYLAVHVLLIAHGRTYCRARRPLCRECPINALCPSCPRFVESGLAG